MSAVPAKKDRPLDLPPLATHQEFAAFLGVTTRTIQRLNARCEGPPVVRVGRQLRYRREAVMAWLASREQV